ncbi:sigma factor-like helix-turn-helix DNA-binding protein [Mucilaginibacter sp.]|uniref:RNA polymerase sigma factor n=1 Tax=Mucilaginibacter sp. TaxID=1882438 RepID=UPI002606EB04|nr:sigma factor-like helix-turn-helix DNA-binding protein [Mucilaginibacter sp.]MDB4926643.1 polymerase subunit sigma-24 [Mucilaginibacter sp.]
MQYRITLCKRQGRGIHYYNKGFYSAFTYLSDYKETTAFEEWLRYFMVQASIKHYLDKKQLPALVVELTTDDMDSNPYNLEDGSSYSNGIKMLHQLPDLCRIVFNLFVIEGYEHEKIAGLLDISACSSQVVLTSARKKLSSLMSME